ncbi:MAG: RHS repeat-associated core domain-containing protein [Acidobacteria bacterium]|nr:RHS repeat-associated core domain-containing protein [Acidobacteriota bacterium]
MTETYVYDAFGRLAAEYSTAGPSGTAGSYFRTSDHLGSTRLVTDGAGNVHDRRDFFPFGEQILASSTYSNRDDVTGYNNSNPASAHLFTGKERDEESGLDYFLARYYSGTLGRFTGADRPLVDQWAQAPQSWNLYGYVRNNPLRFTDPSGFACVVSANGSRSDDDSGGQSCAEVEADPVGDGVEVRDLGTDGTEVFDISGNLSVSIPPNPALASADAELADFIPTTAILKKSVLLGSVVLGMAKTAGRGALWKITKEGTEQVFRHAKFGKFYKSKGADDWITIDRAGHGGSAFKLYRQKGNKLVWQADLDQAGNIIIGKHKGPIGREIPLSELLPSEF